LDRVKSVFREKTHMDSQAQTFAGSHRPAPHHEYDSLGIDARRGGPPPQVLEEIELAGRIHSELLEDGREVRFHGGVEGSLLIELCTTDGALLRALGANEVADLAAGRVTA
jgi:hypothetical protein